MKEQSQLFGQYQSLVGIITEPEVPNGSAILLLNAGLIHRVGPNRIYVKLARQLAKEGFLVLRFDLSGIGDSKVRPDNLPFQKSNLDDIKQAMDYLQQTHGINQFLLAGHCGGAVNSFLASLEDKRVIGIGLINIEGGDPKWSTYDNKRKLSRYYENYYGKTALTDASRWKKLLTGKAAYGSIARNIFQNIIWNRISNVMFGVKNRFEQKMNSQKDVAPDSPQAIFINGLQALTNRDVNVLLIYAEGSTGMERTQFLVGKDLRAMKDAGKIRMELIRGADHTFTLVQTQKALFNVIETWSKSVTAQHIKQPA